MTKHCGRPGLGSRGQWLGAALIATGLGLLPLAAPAATTGTTTSAAGTAGSSLS